MPTKSVFAKVFDKPRENAPDRSVSRRTPRPKIDDVCANRHGGDSASAAAWQKARKGVRQTIEMLIEVFRAHGELTSHEIAEIIGVPNRNSWAPRISDMLHRYNLLEQTGQMRNGCHVLRLKEGV